MRAISKKALRVFWERFPDSKDALLAWYREAERAEWRSPADVKQRYASASFVGDRVVFNVKGNRYRLVVRINYAFRVVLIRFVGTHQEYDGIDVREV